MRIAFFDSVGWGYRVKTAYSRPMGGAQSTLCYLSEALSRMGHSVFLFNRGSRPEVSRGVACIPLNLLDRSLLRSFDVCVERSATVAGPRLKPHSRQDTRWILWNGHAHDQPAVQALGSESVRAAYDGIVLLSRWQQRQFVSRFGLNPQKTAVMQNAVAPAFENLFGPDSSIPDVKRHPPIIAYTSTPFRGLSVLLDVFPEIRRRVAGVRLKVYSSMAVYRVSPETDRFARLYERCRRTEGVEYVGSLPQPELARELRTASVLAYPNTFPETACIAAMEAMAAGCSIVTSRLGALPETTAGFARLVPVYGDWRRYKSRFVEETVAALGDFLAADRAGLSAALDRQVAHANRKLNWRLRAEQWSQWLQKIRKGRKNTHPGSNAEDLSAAAR